MQGHIFRDIFSGTYFLISDTLFTEIMRAAAFKKNYIYILWRNSQTARELVWQIIPSYWIWAASQGQQRGPWIHINTRNGDQTLTDLLNLPFNISCDACHAGRMLDVLTRRQRVHASPSLPTKSEMCAISIVCHRVVYEAKRRPMEKHHAAIMITLWRMSVGINSVCVSVCVCVQVRMKHRLKMKSENLNLWLYASEHDARDVCVRVCVCVCLGSCGLEKHRRACKEYVGETLGRNPLRALFSITTRALILHPY